MHVPKTGGTTVQRYLTYCIGGKKMGRRQKLGEILLDRPPSDSDIERARVSRFICGHFSWASIERMGRSDSDYVFTFLREPKSRLHSFYRFMTNYPDDHLSKSVRSRVERCRGMSQLDMYTTDDIDIRNMVDNYMVRQLSGRLTTYPIAEWEWPVLLETAKRNLESLNYVGFQETYGTDFVQIMRDLQMPRVEPVPRENATVGGPLGAWKQSDIQPESAAAVMTAMAPLVRWDEMLYEHALALREARAA